MTEQAIRPRPFTKARLDGLMRARRTQNIFWRHDVDVSLDAAADMAKFERERDIQAVYYLMVDSPFYSAEEAFLFSRLLEGYGHRVGWHVDERRWEINEGAQLDFEMPVSFHCPTEAVLWKRLPGIDNAYDPTWRGRYYSDSRGRFSHGDPEDHAPGVIQINLHPEWWFAPTVHRDIPDDVYEAFWHEPKSELAQP